MDILKHLGINSETVLAEVETHVAKWDSLTEDTLEKKYQGVLNKARSTSEGSVVELVDVSPSEIPGLFYFFNERGFYHANSDVNTRENGFHIIVSSLSGCNCGNPTCPDADRSHSYTVFISDNRDYAQAMVNKRAKERGLVSRDPMDELIENGGMPSRIKDILSEALKEAIERGDIPGVEAGDGSRMRVALARIGADGQIEFQEGDSDIAQDIITTHKRTIH